MKITGFRPLIITNDAEAVIDMFEDLGFALRHTKTGIGENSDTNYVMKDSGGNRVYITGSESTRSDLTGISINVDDFEETYDFLMARGFRDPRGGQVTETPSSRTTMLYSPSGFPLFITEHITDSPYKTGIIGAMKEEVDTLKAALTKLKTSTIAGMEFNEGKLNGKSVVVVQCGMGKVNAGICANTLVHTFGVDRIINTGVAGSLNADIDIGDLVISTDAVQHDFTVEAIGFKKGEIPYTGLYAFPADDELRAMARRAAEAAAPDSKVFEGRVCSGDQFIATREQKESILEAFGGMCCEMEGGAIAHACYLNHTPFVIIRAISDKADDSEEVSFETFAEQAAKHCAAIVRYMISH